MTATLFLALASMASAGDDNIKTLDGITFYEEKGAIYARLREVATSFGESVNSAKGSWFIGKRQIDPRMTRRLLDGTLLVRLSSLANYGYLVRWDKESNRAVVKWKEKPGVAIFVRKGDQRVVVNKSHLMLVGWQGQSVVFRSPVGIGRMGYETPNGQYKVQPYRTKMHLSSIYNNTPMPWAVQIVGNIFVHGSPQARGRSSHGCIRLATSGANPAKWFYSWVEKGTPVSVQGHWPANAKN
jgi:lipoprotein-anchoring transpeptidase ErfK/SrfK